MRAFKILSAAIVGIACALVIAPVLVSVVIFMMFAELFKMLRQGPKAWLESEPKIT